MITFKLFEGILTNAEREWNGKNIVIVANAKIIVLQGYLIK